MLKNEVRKIIGDRAVTRYTRATIAVLDKIVDLTHVPDWRKDHIENFFSAPKSVSQFEFLTRLEWHTVKRALKLLVQEGVIKPNPKTKGSYSVQGEILKTLSSNYQPKLEKKITRKILKAVRMRFTRNPKRTVAPWAETHPEQCPCVPSFCSHPSTI